MRTIHKRNLFLLRVAFHAKSATKKKLKVYSYPPVAFFWGVGLNPSEVDIFLLCSIWFSSTFLGYLPVRLASPLFFFYFRLLLSSWHYHKSRIEPSLVDYCLSTEPFRSWLCTASSPSVVVVFYWIRYEERATIPKRRWGAKQSDGWAINLNNLLSNIFRFLPPCLHRTSHLKIIFQRCIHAPMDCILPFNAGPLNRL